MWPLTTSFLLLFIIIIDLLQERGTSRKIIKWKRFIRQISCEVPALHVNMKWREFVHLNVYEKQKPFKNNNACHG